MSFFIFNHNLLDVCLTPSRRRGPSLSPLSNTVATVSSYSPPSLSLSVFSLVRLLCLKSKLHQGKLSGSWGYVIDRLTESEKERDRERYREGEWERPRREDARKLVWTGGSISVCLDASLLARRHPGHTGWDDGWRAEERRTGVGGRAGEGWSLVLRGHRWFGAHTERSWDVDGEFPVSQTRLVIYLFVCLLSDAWSW